MKKLFDYFQTLSAHPRRNLYLGGLVAAAMAVASFVVYFGGDGQPLPLGPQRKVEYNLFKNQSPRDVSAEALSGQVKRVSTDVNDLRLQLSQQNDRLGKLMDLVNQRAEASDQKVTEVRNLAEEMARQAEASRGAQPGPAPSKRPATGSAIPPDVGAQPPAAPPDPTVPVEGSGLKIRVLTGASNSPDKQKKDREAKAGEKPVAMIRESINDPDRTRQGQRIDPILPTGSILSGTVITGLDAPTASQAMQNPFPALLRIKHEAILPNRFRMDIRECFLVAGGYGDLSSERAYLRAESLSCVKSNGEVIDATLDAYAVGEDGKAGVRGRVVSKNGQIIANSLLSGFIAGIGKAFVPTRSTPIQLNPMSGSDIPYQWPSPEMVGAQAFVGGVRGAAEQIAEYYLEMAKNMFPVVEVDAGRKVDFIVLRGVALKPGLNGGGSGGPRTAGLATAGQMLSQAGSLLSGQGPRMGGHPGGGGGYGAMGGYGHRGQALSAATPLLNGAGGEALLK